MEAIYQAHYQIDNNGAITGKTTTMFPLDPRPYTSPMNPSEIFGRYRQPSGFKLPHPLRRKSSNHGEHYSLPPLSSAPLKDPFESDESDSGPYWNDPVARKRHLKHQIHDKIAKAFKKGISTLHTFVSHLSRKKSISPEGLKESYRS